MNKLNIRVAVAIHEGVTTPRKVQSIKMLRVLTGLSLRDAKERIDAQYLYYSRGEHTPLSYIISVRRFAAFIEESNRYGSDFVFSIEPTTDRWALEISDD